MTDKEIWELILDNKKLLYFFANRFTRRHPGKVEAFMSYLYEHTFRSIKNGYLDRGSLSGVVGYAAMQANREYLAKYVPNGISLPTHVTGQYKQIFTAFNKDTALTTSKGLKYSKFEINTIMAAIDTKNLVLEDLVGGSDLHAMPDYHNIHGTNLDRDWDLAGVDVEKLLRFLVESLGRQGQVTCQVPWQQRSQAVKALYVVCRFYEIERYALELAPDLYGFMCAFDIVTPVINRIIKRKENLSSANQKPMRDVTLADIGSELDMSRERVRQYIVLATDAMRKFTEV